ncbi:MAG TPA: cytochrome ubiquinol oxidase subunit I [Acidimicrobiales bacterium]|nr:cytochrome ubiquinol oxidase subunit I [Acidimicrobiales bacterium]
MTLILSRWQFAIVTVFHFFFVPVTIGLGFMVAIMQTLAYRRGDEGWDKLTRFFGRLFLINLAVGVVTGIVLEFEFGLNWSAYSIFVGNIFGAPLAMEALLAFFLESTFVGVWIFGRGRLSPRLHLASIWAVSIGTMLSALFILAANTWMQHPVGYRVVHGQAVLTNFWDILGNSTLWGSFAHTILAAFATGGALVLGISVWRAHKDRANEEHRAWFVRTAKFAAGFTLAAVLLTSVAGDSQARLMDSQQPMKMASAEALYNTAKGASFSLLTIGNLKGKPVFQIRVPHVLSLIADLSWNGQVQGINQVQAKEAARYGAGSYVPVIWLTYWSFRAMVGAGILLIVLSAFAVWALRRRKMLERRWFRRLALIGIVLPFIANTSGWIFTEAGRQPWIVYGLLTTAKGVSSVPAADVLATLIVFILVYSVLGAVDFVLMRRYAMHPLDEPEMEPAAAPGTVPSLVY